MISKISKKIAGGGEDKNRARKKWRKKGDRCRKSGVENRVGCRCENGARYDACQLQIAQ